MEGNLIFDSNRYPNDIKISANNIWVKTGSMIAGTSMRPFTRNLEINLKGIIK